MPRDSGISCVNFNFRYTGLELQRQWENVHFRSLFCAPVLPIVGHGPANTLRVSASGASRPRAMPVLDILNGNSLTQIVRVNIPTRQDKILDLILTNYPSTVDKLETMPSIGESDHDVLHLR